MLQRNPRGLHIYTKSRQEMTGSGTWWLHHKGTGHSTQLSLTQSHSTCTCMLHGKGEEASQIIWAKNNKFKWFMFLWLHMYRWLDSLSILNGTASSLTLEAQLIIFINIAIDLAIIWIRLVQVGRNDSTTTSLSIRVRDSKLPADGFDWSWTIPIFSLSPYSSYVNEVIFALREVQHASDINHHVPYAMTYRLPSMWFFFPLTAFIFINHCQAQD